MNYESRHDFKWIFATVKVLNSYWLIFINKCMIFVNTFLIPSVRIKAFNIEKGDYYEEQDNQKMVCSCPGCMYNSRGTKQLSGAGRAGRAENGKPANGFCSGRKLQKQQGGIKGKSFNPASLGRCPGRELAGKSASVDEKRHHWKYEIFS